MKKRQFLDDIKKSPSSDEIYSICTGRRKFVRES